MEYYIYGGIELSPAEFDYVLKFESLNRWTNTRVLYDENGEEIPEMWIAMIAIESYKLTAQNKASGNQQWYDVGAA